VALAEALSNGGDLEAGGQIALLCYKKTLFWHLCYNVPSCYIGLALTWLFTEIFGSASSLASSLEDNNLQSNQEFKY
jgi:hypothetical protein